MCLDVVGTGRGGKRGDAGGSEAGQGGRRPGGPVPGLSSKLADRPPLQGATKASHFGLHLRSSENARPERTLDNRQLNTQFYSEGNSGPKS